MERLIFLAGFMGTGKSTVGRLLARRLRLPFVDLDDVIARRERRSIPELFAAGRFRSAEARALRSLRGPAVVALGGGALLRPSNRRLVERTGVLVRLTCPERELWRRLKPALGKRPLLAGGRPALRRLLAERRRVPVKARLTVSTSGRTPAAVAARIARSLL